MPTTDNKLINNGFYRSNIRGNAEVPYGERCSRNVGRYLNSLQEELSALEIAPLPFGTMFSGVCGESGPLDFSSPCIRASWGAFIPASFVFGLCFLSSPLAAPFRKAVAILGSPLKPFLTVQEAEALCVDETIRRDEEREVVKTECSSRWHMVVFVTIGLLECLSWTIFGSFQLYEGPTNVWVGAIPFLVSVSWLYSAVRAIVRPIATSPYDLFVLYAILFSTAVLRSCGILYDQIFLGVPPPTNFTFMALIADLICAFLGLGTTLVMPLGIPDPTVDRNEIVCCSIVSNLLHLTDHPAGLFGIP